jgi:peptidoglycan/xylan/chitin deacetylase (PgdA/CDA1 family)
MIASIQRLIRRADCLVARAYLSVVPERGGLLAFLFHSLFRDEREIALNQVDPLQRTTVAQFRAFLAYYRAHGYTFVGPDELDGLEPGGKYALVTFDDGYYNNTRALPVLEEFRAPAVFFISTDHVREGKSFWWDVLYRERVAQGASPRQVYREAVALKSLTTEAIEAELVRRFGPDALRARGDVDRPFTPDELRAFARHPLVRLGNHTANHAILTNYSADEARAQILRAQDALEAMTGTRPRTIAFPNGARSDAVLRACAELGLRAGFTIRPAKNALPAAPGLVQVDRFALHDELPVETQCRTCRSDVLLYGLLRAGYLRMARGWANAST